MKQTYTIKPLKWEEEELKNNHDSIEAETPFGNYRVYKVDEKLFWGYCFCSYYDEDNYECTSIQEGKKEAEAHWLNRIKETLKK